MAVKSPPGRPAARQPRPSQATKVRRPKPPRNNDRFPHDMWGLSLVALGVILLVSLILGSRAGLLGTALGTGLREIVGIGAWVFPVVLAAIGVMLITGREQHTRTNFAGGAALLFVIGIAWWHLGHTTPADEFNTAQLMLGGGWVGAALSSGLRALVSDLGSHVFLFFVTIGGIVWATDMRLLHLFDHAVEGGRRVTAPLSDGAKAGAAAVKEKVGKIRQEPNPGVTADPSLRGKGEELGQDFRKMAVSEAEDLPTVPRVSLPVSLPAVVKPLAVLPTPIEKPKAPAGPLMIPEALGNDGTKHEYVLPPLELLNESPPKPIVQEKDAQEKQAVLMQTLNDFKIGANVSQVAIGPTVTRYEVQLEPGILVKKIVSLADNLAMSLAAIDVRVEAPIPGKAAIGIEVPNDVRQMVSLRECLATNEFMNAPSKLTFALGKDVSGEFKYADLTRMPHLLVGGSTNSGKSVCLNVIISSILYRATPREVKFVMIDPKRVELSLYDGIPHLLSPVIKDVKQAAGIFRSVLKEMEERYDRFARMGTRNIEGFNSRVPPDERLPFIVVVVDELADLMMQQGPEVETSICRLAQLARATGIHLVIATQRPSVDVITGTIKANIGSRIAFSVATQVDSRTIIDMPGADRLIGRGDMLYMPIDAAKPLRVQGCFIGERETEDLVKYLRDQEEAVYTMIPSEMGGGGSGGGDDYDDGSSDELFEPCVRWLVLQGQCSTSSLQRKFKIGYTRAARLVEFMEARQIVGSQDGVKPREILLRPENVEAFFLGTGKDRFEYPRSNSARPAAEGNTNANQSNRENLTHPQENGIPEKEEQQDIPQQTVPSNVNAEKLPNLLSHLNSLTGLGGVKSDMQQLVNLLHFQQLRKSKGLSVPEQSLHMVFTGNPGTGKTTIARLVSQIYKSMGILTEGQFVETDRAGLIGGYLGQTALKTQEVVQSAIGGVLFIDEAYSLTDDTHGHDQYGQEAVSTLLKLMEDHRDDLIVIVAGYTEPMQKFIRSNPGLQSRFNKFLHFDDYAPVELTEIFRHFAIEGDYKLHLETELKLEAVFEALYDKRDETFGNARLARNLFEKAINAHANRMVAAEVMDEESLVTLYPEDIPNA